MEIHRSATDALTFLAPAKLNLYFEVLAKRADGFHEIETLMAPIRLFDELQFRARADGEIKLACQWAQSVERDARFWRDSPADATRRAIEARVDEAPANAALANAALANESRRDSPSATDELPDERQNLVYRALALLRDEAFTMTPDNVAARDDVSAKAAVAPGADVLLVKRIPLAAGLAGGSSDAASALVAANIAWGLNWPLARLASLAARLGSDVPFFLYRAPAICRGRGEQIERVGRLPSAWLVIVKPAAGLSTAEVYRHCRPVAVGEVVLQRAEQLAAALSSGNRRTARGLMGNRLEAAAERLSDWPMRLRDAFARSDCDLKQMSGSGTSYFGIGRHARHARRVARQLAARRLGSVFAVRS